MIARIALGSAVLSLLLILASGPGYRMELWHFRTGIQIVMASGLIAVPAVLLGAIALMKRSQPWMAMPAVLIGAALLALGLSWAWAGKTLPRIHDITTDTVTPPEFVAILPLRAGADNPSAYGGPEIARLQKEAYPDIETRFVSLPPDQVFERAMSVANSLKWQIVAADAASGRIEATETTPWFGFKDDVGIRILPDAARGTRVDLRSVSRVGLSDLGTNARRIRSFLEKLLAPG